MAVVGRNLGNPPSYIDATYANKQRVFDGVSASNTGSDDDDEDEQKVAIDSDGRPWTTTAPSSAQPVVALPKQASDKTHDQTVEDLTKLRNEIANRPTLSSPKWWQRGVGMAVGAMAGWSNAASRTKNPIDTDELRDDILQPGHKQKLAEWNSRVQPLEQTAQIDTNLENLERQKRALDITDDWRKSEALKNQSIAEMNARRVFEKPDPQKAAMARYDLAKNKLNMNEGAAQYYAANGNLNGYGSTLESSKAPAQKNLNAEDILLHPKDFSPETVAEAKRQDDRRDKVAHTPDELTQQLKQARLEELTNKSNETVEKNKTTEFDKLHAARIKEIGAVLKDSGHGTIEQLMADAAKGNAPVETANALAAVQRINGSYAGRLQGTQDAYERSVGVRHNSAGHMAVGVNPKTQEIEFNAAPAAQTGRPAAAPSAAPKAAASPAPAAAKDDGKVTTILVDVVDPKTKQVTKVPITGTQAKITAYMKENGLTMAKQK